MKHSISTLKNFFTKKVDIFSLCAGIIIALLLTSFVHTVFMSFFYNNHRNGMRDHKIIMTEKREDHKMSGTMMDHSKMKINMENTNPYMMSEVTSEKQFLEDMVLHHQAAVIMAEQVLTIPQIHTETKTLAEAIIKAQRSEIQKMNEWLTMWK